jgi:hypothetical protein
VEPHVALVLVVLIALVALVARGLTFVRRALLVRFEILFALAAEKVEMDALLVKPAFSDAAFDFSLRYRTSTGCDPVLINK